MIAQIAPTNLFTGTISLLLFHGIFNADDAILLLTHFTLGARYTRAQKNNMTMAPIDSDKFAVYITASDFDFWRNMCDIGLLCLLYSAESARRPIRYGFLKAT